MYSFLKLYIVFVFIVCIIWKQEGYNMKKIGIKDIGIKTPLRKIKSEDIIKVWSNTPEAILKKT